MDTCNKVCNTRPRFCLKTLINISPPFSPQMYIMLNIRIVLVGLEIWKSANIISTDGGAGDVLANFVQWREKNLVLRRRHDSAQLVL